MILSYGTSLPTHCTCVAHTQHPIAQSGILGLMWFFFLPSPSTEMTGTQCQASTLSTEPNPTVTGLLITVWAG